MGDLAFRLPFVKKLKKFNKTRTPASLSGKYKGQETNIISRLSIAANYG